MSAYSGIPDKLARADGRRIKVAAGFDACVDTIARAVRVGGEEPEFFRTIDEFGRYLCGKAGLSCTVDMLPLASRYGGNMPNLAAALGGLGAEVHCIGNLGWPTPDSVFAGLSTHLHSFGEAGYCHAIQFLDGKIMQSNMHTADGIDYPLLAGRVGPETLRELYAGSDAAAFLNWAEIKHATEIWRSIIRTIIVTGVPDKSKLLLIDLTDCASKSVSEIKGVVQTVREANSHRRVVWSMNENEARQLSLALGICEKDPARAARSLLCLLGAELLVIHGIYSAVYADTTGARSVPGFPVAEPAVSVGAGDTFNAGLLWALCTGFPAEEAVLFANGFAAFFVARGHPATAAEMRAFFSKRPPGPA